GGARGRRGGGGGGRGGGSIGRAGPPGPPRDRAASARAPRACASARARSRARSSCGRFYDACRDCNRESEKFSFAAFPASRYCRKQKMLEAPPQPATRRALLDGGYTVALLTVAIVAGYGILAPSPAPAKPVASTPKIVGAVVTP